MRSALLKYLGIVFFFVLFAPLLRAEGAKRNFTLVIDAGHGGRDAGAVGAFSKEKDINLNVALAFGRLVEENCPDVKVIYTRRTDVFIPLQRRADIANNAKADLFVSIHTNALPNGRIAYGAETYTLGMARASANLAVAQRENSVITFESDYKRTYEGFDPNKAESYVIFEFMQDKYMKQSVDLASCIQRQYKSAGRADKGVHQAGFLVLRNTSMPSVLTELGFISTPAEESYLNSRKGVTELSRSIYNGFLAYRRIHDKSADDLPENLPTQVSGEEPNLSVTPAAAEKEMAVVPVETGRPSSKDAAKDNDAAQASATAKDGGSQAAAVKKDSGKTAKSGTSETAAATARTAGAKERENSAASAGGGVIYRVQLGAGKTARSTTDSQFKGLTVTRVKEGDMYKYFYGKYETYQEAKSALKTAQAKLPDAYIVAYVDGKSVPVATARAKEKEKR